MQHKHAVYYQLEDIIVHTKSNAERNMLKSFILLFITSPCRTNLPRNDACKNLHCVPFEADTNQCNNISDDNEYEVYDMATKLFFFFALHFYVQIILLRSKGF